MDRRTRTLFAVLFVIILSATVVAAILLGASNAPEPDPPAGSLEMVGVVIAVDGQDLGDIQGFTLRSEDGDVVEFDLRALENAAEFPPGHLAEHQATAEPVRVIFIMEGEDHLAIELEDATD